MPTVLLVRHGETDWNRSGQIMGERPIPLNTRGEAQAQALAGVLGPGVARAVYSSPIQRARQTAQILAAAVERPVDTDHALTEIGVGEWEGKFWRDLTDDLIRHNFYAKPDEARPPGGETLREVQVRAVAAVQRAIEQPGLSGEDRLVIVSHADVIRAIVAHYLELDLKTIRRVRIEHASVTAIGLADGVADLLFLNYTPAPEALR